MDIISITPKPVSIDNLKWSADSPNRIVELKIEHMPASSKDEGGLSRVIIVTT